LIVTGISWFESGLCDIGLFAEIWINGFGFHRAIAVPSGGINGSKQKNPVVSNGWGRVCNSEEDERRVENGEGGMPLWQGRMMKF
jgi:hypothetical protein